MCTCLCFHARPQCVTCVHAYTRKNMHVCTHILYVLSHINHIRCTYPDHHATQLSCDLAAPLPSHQHVDASRSHAGCAAHLRPALGSVRPPTRSDRPVGRPTGQRISSPASGEVERHEFDLPSNLSIGRHLTSVELLLLNNHKYRRY